MSPLPADRAAALAGFVGREREIAQVDRLLAPTRLVTLVGPGGVGKSRLAFEAAAAASAAFPDGVAFVALAPIRQPELVLPAVAQALGVTDRGARPLLEGVADELRGGRLLLVLDNFEQVAAAAPVVADLLAAAPSVAVLVTSRVPLRLPGEEVFPVSPLAVPPAGAPLPAEAALVYPAVRLFMERARLARPAFAPGADDATAIGAICRWLDGLPLAIELAAAHLTTMDPVALLGRIERRLPLPAGGPARPDRQRTMRAAIAWSHDLLGEPERTLFRRLAVFAGAFSPAAAAAVGVAPGEDPAEAPGLVDSLAAQSLLRREAADGAGPRFGMLETIRAYALEQLEASGEGEATRGRHAAYYLALAEATAAHAAVDAWDDALYWDDAHPATIGAAIADLRAAVEWALAAGTAETALRLCCALVPFWGSVGPMVEGRRALERALALAGDAPPALRARAHRALAALANLLGEPAVAATHAERALALLPAAGEARGQGWLLLGLGDQAQNRGDAAAAEARYREALGVLAEAGDREGTGRVRLALARLAAQRGRAAVAAADLAAARAIFRSLGHARGQADALFEVGAAHRDRGDAARAFPLLAESVARYRRLAAPVALGLALTHLGDVARRLGDADAARAALAEAVALGHAADAPHLLGFAHFVLGHLALDAGDRPAAAARFASALAAYRGLGDRTAPSYVLAGTARLALAAGESELAVRLLAAGDACRRRAAWAWAGVDLSDMGEVRGPARAALGDVAFDAAWAAGAALALEDAEAEAEGLAARLAGAPRP